MQHELRDYQEAAVSKLRESIAKGNRRLMLQMPTGAGKTATAASIIRSALGKDKRVIFTVPALSLITQTIKSFNRDGIHDIGVMQGMHELTDASASVQICSIQTLARRSIPDADLVMVDEAHVVFDLYKRWFNDPEWRKTPIIGLSATPWTKGLGKLYDELVVGTTTQQLIDEGYLSKFRVYAPSKPNLDGVKTIAGDYDLAGLGEAMNKTKLVADIVDTWIKLGGDRPTICFAVNRAHAANICDSFNRAGIAAAYVDGETPLDERDELAQEFRDGRYKVICNVGVMTTGVDLPFVSCLILARPTKSEMLYCQIVGRGLRMFEGKEDCLILDHSDTTARLGFVTDIHYGVLDDGKKKLGGSTRRDKVEALPKVCAQCTYLKPAKVRVCPACGFEAKPRSNVFNANGDLHEVSGRGGNKTYSEVMSPFEEKELFYRELLGICEERNYKMGWAYHQYKTKYHEFPDKEFVKIAAQPSAKTISWVRHQWIKKKKAEQKANGGFV
jgi:superfamily II DNA or RNA helicase